MQRADAVLPTARLALCHSTQLHICCCWGHLWATAVNQRLGRVYPGLQKRHKKPKQKYRSSLSSRQQWWNGPQAWQQGHVAKGPAGPGSTAVPWGGCAGGSSMDMRRESGPHLARRCHQPLTLACRRTPETVGRFSGLWPMKRLLRRILGCFSRKGWGQKLGLCSGFPSSTPPKWIKMDPKVQEKLWMCSQ